jgi:hypothetical protein
MSEAITDAKNMIRIGEDFRTKLSMMIKVSRITKLTTAQPSQDIGVQPKFWFFLEANQYLFASFILLILLIFSYVVYKKYPQKGANCTFIKSG